MKKTIIFLAIIFFTSLILSCSKTDITNEIVYSTSFESTQDSIDWQGYYMFSDDCPINGGNKSLSVIGGCLSGYAKYSIGTLDNDRNLILSCWTKSNGYGGEIRLNTENERISILSTQNNLEWQYFETPDTLFCPASQEVTIGIYGNGGITGGGILNVDLLKVIAVE